MADIWTTVKNESIAKCTLPDDSKPPETVAVESPTAAKILAVMADLRTDPASRFHVREIADRHKVKMEHVAEIRAAMAKRIADAAAPKEV